jgi:LysR family carnitine catabolism transcriptional activator
MTTIQKLVVTQLAPGDQHTTDLPHSRNIQAMISMVDAGHGVAAPPGFLVPAYAGYDMTVHTLVEQRSPPNCSRSA